MPQMFASTRDNSLWTAKITGIFCGLASAGYAAMQIEPFPAVTLFLSFAPLLTIILWLQKDAKRIGVPQILDLGLFLWLAWPIMLPWYAFKTRGRAGWSLSLGLFILVGSGYLGWLITAWTIYGVRYALWYLQGGT